MKENPIDIAHATDEELAAAQLDSKFADQFYRISAEIRRRQKGEKAEPPPIEPEVEPQRFDTRTEISADAKFLWSRIFIWFWIVPVIAGLLWTAISYLR